VSIQVALAIALTLMALFGFALTKAAGARRRPAVVGMHRLVGEGGQVRGENLVFVDGELWRARTADGTPLRPGERVRVESFEQDGLRLLVASSPDPAERT
ncbi:MAG: NfeD family protein, partial [Gaiellaceae bacterium]